MSRFWRWRTLAILAVLAGGAALVLWPRGRQSDVAQVLEQTAATLSVRAGEDDAQRGPRLERELRAHLTRDAEVIVPGLAVAIGPDEIVRTAVRLTRGRRPVLSVRSPDVRLDARHHATVRFEVVTSDSAVPDLHSRARHANAELVEEDGGWKIRSLSISPEERAEPEPRP
jgi:hypothetical protein